MIIQGTTITGGNFGSIAKGQTTYTTPGTYSWTAPEGVYSVSVVAIGGGGGGSTYGAVSGGAGGGLGYKNNISVTPGQTYTVVVGAGGDPSTDNNGVDGGDSYFIDTSTVKGGGGQGARSVSPAYIIAHPDSITGSYYHGHANAANGGAYTGDGGGNGGKGGIGTAAIYYVGQGVSGRNVGGGGGAGGYNGNGGDGANALDDSLSYPGSNAATNSGGGGGASTGQDTLYGFTYSGAGGGTGILGKGDDGLCGYGLFETGGGYGGRGGLAGSSGNRGSDLGGSSLVPAGGSSVNGATGGTYGGGGTWYRPGGSGAVRIIWPGASRQFPGSSTAYYSSIFRGFPDNYSDLKSYLVTPSSTAFALGTGNFTIECWVYFTGNLWTGLDTSIIDFRSSTTEVKPRLRLIKHPTINYGQIKYNVNGTDVLGATIDKFIWYHIAVVKSSNSTKLYVNGTQSGTAYSDTNNYGTSAQSVTIGRTSDDYNAGPLTRYDGLISNVRILKGSAAYSTTFVPSTTPLTAIANTSLLTCQSSTIIDNSTNNFTITVGDGSSGTVDTGLFSPFAITGDTLDR